jgi:hypothetical protein
MMRDGEGAVAKVTRRKREAGTNNATKPAIDPRFLDFEPKTELGRKLLEIRRRYIDAGGELLDEAGLEREIAERRGSVVYVQDDAQLR